MTPRARYDAAVEATRLPRAVFNDLTVCAEDLRRDLYVAAMAAERIATKLYPAAFYGAEEPRGRHPLAAHPRRPRGDMPALPPEMSTNSTPIHLTYTYPLAIVSLVRRR